MAYTWVHGAIMANSIGLNSKLRDAEIPTDYSSTLVLSYTQN